MTDTSALPQFVVSAFDGREFSDWASQSRETLLNHFLEWNGICGYTGQILQAITAIDQFLEDNRDPREDLEKYIETEFRKLFPRVDTIEVSSVDEVLAVVLSVDVEGMGLTDMIVYHFVAGSDDDYYLFEPQHDWAKTHPLITIPLMPEA